MLWANQPKQFSHINDISWCIEWNQILPWQITPAPSLAPQLACGLCLQSNKDFSVPSHITSSAIKSVGTIPNLDLVEGSPDQYLTDEHKHASQTIISIPKHTASNCGVIFIPPVIAHWFTIHKYISFCMGGSSSKLYHMVIAMFVFCKRNKKWYIWVDTGFN